MKIDHSVPLEYSTEENKLKILGFWIFLCAEVALFATLFAMVFAYYGRYGNGPTVQELFEIKPVLFETFVLLTSSFTIGLGINAMRLGRKKAMLTFFGITLLLGLAFLEYRNYQNLYTYVHEGATIQTSGFLSVLFTTLGTHGAHVTLGFFWGLFIMMQVAKRGFNPATANKAFIFSLYWHFLDVVWIFIFSFVYLKGLM